MTFLNHVFLTSCSPNSDYILFYLLSLVQGNYDQLVLLQLQQSHAQGAFISADVGGESAQLLK